MRKLFFFCILLLACLCVPMVQAEEHTPRLDLTELCSSLKLGHIAPLMGRTFTLNGEVIVFDDNMCIQNTLTPEEEETIAYQGSAQLQEALNAVNSLESERQYSSNIGIRYFQDLNIIKLDHIKLSGNTGCTREFETSTDDIYQSKLTSQEYELYLDFKHINNIQNHTFFS